MGVILKCALSGFELTDNFLGASDKVEFFARQMRHFR